MYRFPISVILTLVVGATMAFLFFIPGMTYIVAAVDGAEYTPELLVTNVMYIVFAVVVTLFFWMGSFFWAAFQSLKQDFWK